ncbi:MAG: superoxide dismutase family protein [Gemmatimonadaceae bacterium]
MLNKFISLTAIVLASALVACAHAPAPLNRVAVAYATIANAGGTRGTAEMWQDADNVVHVEVQVSGMPAGPHGIHFHAVGSCEPTAAGAFAAAGGHYNPLGRQHGLDNSAGSHAGDAPNFTVNADGTGRASFTTDRVSLTAGSTSLFDADGSAIVIHAGADDQISQPAGNSGARIACGAVRRTL